MGRSRRTSFILLLALACGLLFTVAPSADAASWEETELVKMVRSERSSRDIRTVYLKADLQRVARAHAARMARRGYPYHNPRLEREVKGWRVIGENVAMGTNIWVVHSMLMDSDGHRRNILYSGYNQAGIGIARNGNSLYVVEVFVRRY